MKKQHHHVTPPVRNSIFGKLNSAQITALQETVPPPAQPVRINMCRSVMHFQPVKHISFIAEGLVAFDPKRDAIVKFISLFIPAHDGQKRGKWFKVSASNALLPPIPVEDDPTHKPAWLEWNKMPQPSDGLEFRILRCYFNNKHPGKPMFEILNFDLPEKEGEMVDRKTLVVEQIFNSVPLFALRENWWHLLILKYLGRFVGAELITSTDTKAVLQRLVASNAISQSTFDEILSEGDEEEEETVAEAILPTLTATAVRQAPPAAYSPASAGMVSGMATTVASQDGGEEEDDEGPTNQLVVQPEEEEETVALMD